MGGLEEEEDTGKCYEVASVYLTPVGNWCFKFGHTYTAGTVVTENVYLYSFLVLILNEHSLQLT